MPHKFDPNKKDKLLSDKRYEMLPPQGTLQKLLLEVEDRVADIGSGVGFFSLPAAKIVGDKGKVYAIDIVEEMLTALDRRAKEEEIENIELVKGSEYSAELDNDSIDFMLISNVIHEVKDKEKFLTEYLSKLTSSGKLAIIDWKKKDTNEGPPIDHRISQQQVRELLQNIGLDVVKEVDLNSGQYGLVGKR
ncbi:methyltransferase domain-containing protein [Halanaerocella petrolearia]